MLLAWDKDGNIVRGSSWMAKRDDEGNVIGFVDFEAHELAGGSMTDIVVYGAAGVYPELPPLPDSDFREGRVVFRTSDRTFHRRQGATWVPHTPQVVGAGTWPEHLGTEARNFKVELRPGPKGSTPLVRALVHRDSNHRRERTTIEETIENRIRGEQQRAALEGRPPQAINATDVIGAPGNPLLLDRQGRNRGRIIISAPNLPFRKVANESTNRAPSGE